MTKRKKIKETNRRKKLKIVDVKGEEIVKEETGLEFNEERHEYKWNGKVVPSVSEIVAVLGEDYSHVSEIDKEWGSHIHRLTARFDLEGGKLYKELSPEEKPYIDAWSKFRADFQLEFNKDEIEVKNYSELYRYAGAKDRRRKSLGIDIKMNIYKSNYIQAALYAYLEEPKLERFILVKLGKDGKYHANPMDSRALAINFNTGLSCLNILNWRRGE